MARTQEFNPFSSMNDPDVMRERADSFTQQMRDIEAQQASGAVVEDYKFLGFLSMPAHLGAMLKTFVNPLIMEGGVYLQERADSLVGKHAHKIFSNPAHAKMATAGTALAVGVGTQLSENIYTFWKDLREYKRALSQTATDVAPVLKDIKGSSGFMTLLGVKADENEVIYVRRQRLGAVHSGNHLRNGIGLIEKLPGAARSITSLPALQEQAGEIQGRMQGMVNDRFKSMMIGASGGVAPMVDYYKQSLKVSQQKAQMRPDALQMITSLQETLKHSPDAQEFDVPGTRYNTVSLGNYIAMVFKCHQEDMSKLDKSCSPVRRQLEGKLLEVSERLAQSIREGEISPLMLVRLVGERHVIKRGGRDVASLKEVQAVIRKYSQKAQSYQDVPEKEFYENVPKQDVHELLSGLKGEERQMFMATLPDNILQAEGIGEKEIKEMRDATGARYKQILAEAVAGIAHSDDADLEKMGLQPEGIAQARAAAQEIAEGGLKVVDRLRASPSNTIGLEGIVHQAMIGDKSVTMGALAQKGKVALKQMAEQAANDGSAGEHGFTGRERTRRDMAEDNERGLHS